MNGTPSHVSATITLQAARGAPAQQRAIDAWLVDAGDARQAATDGRKRAVIAEAAFSVLDVPAHVALVRLAAGCVCCTGFVPLRVHLQRLLRAGIDDVLLLIADDRHVERVRALLAEVAPGANVRAGGQADNDEAKS